MTSTEYNALADLLAKFKADEAERWENSKQGKGPYYISMASPHNDELVAACKVVADRVAIRAKCAPKS